MTPVVSVVICTFNRAASLRAALASLRDQAAPSDAYEVIVVDNNSTDETPAVIAEAARVAPVTHVREPLQGLSFARNRGIHISRGELIAFTDDDVRPAADWVQTICRISAERPDIGWFGGRVLPVWSTAAPAWLDATCWAPLALLDFGPSRIELGRDEARSAIGANLVIRRSSFVTAGTFAPDVQRVRDGIGSTEDHELQARMARHGLSGLYEPALIVHSPVDARRMTRQYHRRWHAGHGRFFAVMRDASFERSSRGRILDVPGHVYRALANAAVQWMAASLMLHRAAAFRHELHARFLAAYTRERIRGRLASMRADHGRRVPA
jgi:glycosyltransferase involved in cell wall biosynthesis